MVWNVGDSSNSYRPDVYFAIADDYATAPPGWGFYQAKSSNARPSDNRYGDYNTTRQFFPTGEVWVGAAHWIRRSTDCSSCSLPFYFAFGRDRDRTSWGYWKNK